MAAITRQKKSQVQQRRRTKNKSRRGKSRRRKTTVRHANRSHGKKRPAGKFSRKAWNLELNGVQMTIEAQRILDFCMDDLYKKVSLAAERLKKKKHHNLITVSDVKIALEKIIPRKYDGKPISSIPKCH